MAVVSVWGISAVRPGSPGFRLSSPPVSSRGATPDRLRPSSPRLSPSGARSAASRGRRAAAGPAAACAASRCSAPGLGLGHRGRPLAPGRRRAHSAPRTARSRPNSPAVRPRVGRRLGCRRGGRAASGPGREPRAGLCRRARSSLGGAPTAPAPPAPGRSPPQPAAAPPAPRSAAPALRLGPGVRRSRRGCGGKWG